MFDLKVINSVLDQMEEERGIGREKMLDAIEQSLATAYKKEYGKRGQIVRASFDINTGDTAFEQVKTVVDESLVRMEEEGEEIEEVETPEVDEDGEEKLPRFDAEKHIMLENAKLIKGDAQLGDELVFPLEPKDDFGRIAAQTAKQVIIQKIREAEKESALKEFGQKAGDIVVGHVQRFERGNLYVDLGRVTAIMPYDEQIPGERFKTGDRIRAMLMAVEETPRGIFLKLSRSSSDFLKKLFEIEAPELQNGTVEVKAIAREAGSRSKIAVYATDSHIDPVGSLVGQRGVRVSTVMSELGGEKIDIIEWSEAPEDFIEDALSPAQVLEVKIEEEGEEDADIKGHAIVEVAEDQQSLAIGRGGQNVRLAAKLTGWKIDIVSANTGDQLAEADETGEVEVAEPVEAAEAEVVEETPASEVEEKPEETPEEEPSEEKEETEDKE
ncbi:transcription termination factor NusA [Candidatus Kaiserbacteria bacterium]|nr:transcription termination factor NusA [Candidatus Kaiserbacteria bacterium]